MNDNDLQCTQEDFRGKLCSVNYQQFSPFIFSTGSKLECGRELSCCQLFFSLLGDAWFIATFSALWKWYRFNFFLCKVPLMLTLAHFRESEDFWKVGRKHLKTRWLWICEKDTGCGLLSTSVFTHPKSCCTQHYFASAISTDCKVPNLLLTLF